jgi:hypothetical protein
MLDAFLNRQLPLSPPPYPPLCGALPHVPGARLPLASFVGARIADDWTLCYVAGADRDSYLICDADSMGEDAATFRAHPSSLVPLPQSQPDRKCPLCEFPAGARVLALWPEGSLWTSVFYPARVVNPPGEPGTPYKLVFEGTTKPVHVPLGFVMAGR